MPGDDAAMIVVGVIVFILILGAAYTMMYPSCCARRLGLGLCGSSRPIDLAAAVDDPLPLNMSMADLYESEAFGMDEEDNAGLRSGTTLLDEDNREVVAAAGAGGLTAVGAAMAPFDDAPQGMTASMWASGDAETADVAGSSFPGGARSAAAKLGGYQRAMTRRIGQTYQTRSGVSSGAMARRVGINGDLRAQWQGHAASGTLSIPRAARSASEVVLERPDGDPRHGKALDVIEAETMASRIQNPIGTMRQ